MAAVHNVCARRDSAANDVAAAPHGPSRRVVDHPGRGTSFRANIRATIRWSSIRRTAKDVA